MQRLSTLLTGLCVALALVLAGPGAARGAVNGTMMVLCANGAEDAVWLDESGAPVDPAEACRTCPDCLSPLTVLHDRPHPVAPIVLRAVPAEVALRPAAVPVPTPLLFPVPRGPPPARAKHRTPAQ